MIAGYTRPQLLIRQVLEVLPDQVERSLNAFTVGPQFDLHRYTNAEERAEMIGAAFTENADADPAARQLVPYEGLQSNNVVDQAFTRLYGEKLEGQVLSAQSAVIDTDPNIYNFVMPSLLYPNRIQVVRRQAVIATLQGENGGLNSIIGATVVFGGSGYAASTTIDQPVIDVDGTGSGAVVRLTTDSNGIVVSVAVVAPGKNYTQAITFSATAPSSGANVGRVPDSVFTTPLIPDLHGRPIQPGDVVYADLDGSVTRRIVREIMREVTPAKYGTNADKSDKKFSSSALNPVRTDTSEFGNISAPANWGVSLARGTILRIDVTAPGAGYVTSPVVTISPAIEIDSGGLVWPAEDALASSVVDAGQVSAINMDVLGAGYYLGGVVGILIRNGGAAYDAANPPSIVATTPTDGHAAVLEAVISGGQITGVKILDPGHGYTTHIGNVAYAGSLSLVGGAGAGADIIGVVNVGAVRAINVTAPGTGYTADTVVAGPTGGTNFAAKAYFGANSVEVAAGGTGYAVGDTVELDEEIVDPAARTVYLGRTTKIRITGVAAGVVTAAEIYEAGWYDGAVSLMTGDTPTTTLTGVGIGFTGTIDWGVHNVLVTNPGTDYTAFPITFTGGIGVDTAATADAVSAPTVSLPAGGATASLALRSIAEDWDGLIEGSIYEGKFGERYTITVTKTGSDVDDARVRIRSASGAFSADAVTAFHYGLDYIIDHPALGGLAVSLRPPSASTALKLGDTFTFVVTGAYLPLEVAESGRLIDINVIVNGADYDNGVHSLVIASPPSGGVQAEAQVEVIAGAVVPTTLLITNPGSGYLAAPAISLVAGVTGVGAIFEGIISQAENSRDLTVMQSGVYTGPRDTQYQIRVVRGTDLNQAEESFGGALVRVSDNAGIDQIQEYTVVQGQEYDLGTYGLKFMFPEDQATPSGIAGGGLTATASIQLTADVVSRITVTNGGSGYTTVPIVTIDGDGDGATAEAVIHAGKVIAITITNGGTGYSIAGLTVTIGAPLGYQGGLRTGDSYFINAVAEAANGPHSVIVLQGQAADITGWTEVDLALNKFDLDVRTLYSGLIEPRRNDAPNLAWEAGTTTDGGILVSSNLALELTDRDDGFQWVPVKNGAQSMLFAHWRGLVPATSGDKIRLYYSEQAIIDQFGKDDLDNPACHAAILAFRGGQEKPVFAARLVSNDVAGHTTLIRQAEHIEGIYSIAISTFDLAIKELWAAHVVKMSMENWKLWRRLYIATQNPGPYSTMVTKLDGTDYNATVTTNASGNVRVICADGDFVTRGIRPGDLYRTNFFYDAWGESAYEEYEVYTVNTEDELILKTGPAAPISPAIKFEIWRPDNGLSQAEYVGEQSDNFLNRRVCNIWTDEPNLVDANGTFFIVPTYYLAAEVAGLRAAVLPQQGLSYTELDHSLDGAPLMFTKYSEAELNLAASMGTWIVTQEQEDGPIFIRHQLTTETNKGILYYEDSVGANVDNISYAVKAIFQPYVGRRNTNVETLEEMETKFRNLLDEFKNNPFGFSNIGPALITWRDLSVTIDPVFKDRINAKVILELPLPINTIIVTLMATTASDATIATINATVNTPVTTQ